jgi:hypothetical protein
MCVEVESPYYSLLFNDTALAMQVKLIESIRRCRGKD